jgi:hypothetical protein
MVAIFDLTTENCSTFLPFLFIKICSLLLPSHIKRIKLYAVFNEILSSLAISFGENSFQSAERQIGHGRVDANLDLSFFLFNSTFLFKKF